MQVTPMHFNGQRHAYFICAKGHENVEISLLGTYDTVGALGFPTTGILGFLRITGRTQKKYGFHETNPARRKQRARLILTHHIDCC
jgi:hypothetical protein